MEDFFILFV